MAKMIPSEIGYFEHKSGEDQLFIALSKLPDDYYVFHSYRTITKIGNLMNENEADFLVFNPKYGCLVIEAKQGRVYRKNDGNWYYQSGKKMKDPFGQACGSMYAILNRLKESTSPDFLRLVNGCKFLFGVWFPAYCNDEIKSFNFGPAIYNELILPREALKDPTPYVETIMKRIQKLHVVYKEPEVVEDGNNYRHELNEEESMLLFKRGLCPSFDIVPNKRKAYETEIYSQLLNEQYIILDFLSSQKSAAIAGASGTGKTFVALERARRLSGFGRRILFLCYNSNLKKFLESNYKIDDVDFYTIDGFACKKCKTNVANYYKLREVLENEILMENFEYSHILVDEGQDFGQEDIEASGVLNLLADYGNNGDNTSFFIFYDKYQMVNNSKQLPLYLQNVDSKLTLYKNCRNTKKIADTAYSLIKLNPVTYEGAIKGEAPRFIFYDGTEDLKDKINNIIDKLSKEYDSERVILTCKGTDSNSLKDDVDSNSVYKTSNGKKTKVFTVSKFKGLESDNVLLIDVDKECFNETNVTFYVGASRAKRNLFIFLNINDSEITIILQKRFPKAFPQKNKKQQITLAMHGIYDK